MGNGGLKDGLEKLLQTLLPFFNLEYGQVSVLRHQLVGDHGFEMHIFVGGNGGCLLRADPRSFFCLQVSSNLLPGKHEIQAREEGAAVFAERINDFDGTFGDRVSSETSCDYAGNEQYDQQAQRGGRSKESETTHEKEEEEASNKTKCPVGVVRTGVEEHSSLQYHGGNDDETNRPEAIRVEIELAAAHQRLEK